MPSPPPPTVLVPSERAVVLLSCALSALGSGLLVATHALWPDLRSRARRLLLFLSLADLLSAASYFYGVLQDFAGPSWDCVLQGALSTFANTSSFFWTVAIALYLYLSIVRAARGPRTDRLLWVFHVVSWGVPLAITAAAVALKKIGYDASDVSVGWCWIDLEAEDRVLWMLLTGKLWEMLAYVMLPLLYLLVRKHINRAHAALSEYRPILSEAHRLPCHSSMADKKLVLIPLIFICLRVWSTVRVLGTRFREVPTASCLSSAPAPSEPGSSPSVAAAALVSLQPRPQPALPRLQHPPRQKGLRHPDSSHRNFQALELLPFKVFCIGVTLLGTGGSVEDSLEVAW
ncbi:G-protein coupled receptor 157 isoform X4 [Nycticebus coucang]|uniref:G-protein coupled receptor 157 isoform X4 n=1 Tax=Nycticebus coucang TaxID=9470 RepID=UPI00234D88D3|nr:G-protein coupled receptor 157 isoform X4 [Nycticebus coucang]